ncbi:probable disease resistance protein At1g59620 [Elaeis guineensis]|uniref:probable disease resistance protein At1g59620 n=1 Tax=Elaeis guineensis var. tenera TaxID=51953 RepID=UPI003C6CE465
MASAFLSLILSKAVDLLTKFRRFASPSSSSDPQNGFSEEFNQLERMLQQIRAFLHDAEEREVRDAGVELWLKELKEVAYDLEDVIDRCQYEVLQAQVEERSSREAGRKRKREQEEESYRMFMVGYDLNLRVSGCIDRGSLIFDQKIEGI